MSKKKAFIKIVIPLLIILSGFVIMKILTASRTEPKKEIRNNPGMIVEVMKAEKEDTPSRPENLKFYSSNQFGLQHLFKNTSPATNDIEKLHALAALRENGMLTESEYTSFKKHLLNAIGAKGSQTRVISE